MYGDPAQVRALARQVRDWADDLRIEGSRVRAAEDVRWNSTAAERFRRTLADQARDAADRADAVDELARALLRHAEAVEERLAQIAAAERWVGQEIENAQNAVSAAANSVVGAVSGVVGGVVNWVEDHVSARDVQLVEQIAPRLPPPGSLEWLALADRLR